MPSKDFRASQIQTTQIISSGSSGTNAKIVVYPIESQDQSSLNQGIIDPSSFNTSSIGTDIFLYVSGGIGERNTPNASISVFGGDVFISGNLNVSGNLSVTGSGAGGGGASSLQEAYDGGSTIVLSASVPLAITSSGPNEYIFALLDGTNQSQIQARQIQMIDGSATRPSYGFFADTNTGLYRPEADAVGIAGAGGEIVRFTNTSSNPQVLFHSGSVSVPSFAFIDDPDTGLYYTTNTIRWVIAGSQELYLRANELSPAADGGLSLGTTTTGFDNIYGQQSGGSAATPTFAWAGDTNTGLYRPEADVLGVAAGSVEVVRFVSSSANPQVLFDIGSLAQPSISFTADPDTGFYVPSANRIAMAFAGANGYTFSAAAFWTNGAKILGLNTSNYWSQGWFGSAESATTSGPSANAYDIVMSGTNAGAYAIGVDSSLLAHVSSSVSDVMTALTHLDDAITGTTSSISSYTGNFSAADWQVIGSNELYTISGTTHGLDTDNMQIQVYQSGASGFTLVTPQETQVNASFDVQFTISSGSAFQGQAILLKSGISTTTVLETTFKQFSDTGILLSTTASLQYGSNVSASNQLTFATTTTTGSETVAAMTLPLSGNRVYDMDFTILAAGTSSGITKRFKRNLVAYDYGSPAIMGGVAFAAVPDVSGSAAAATADVDFAISASNVVCYVSGVVSESISWTVNAFVTKGEN